MALDIDALTRPFSDEVPAGPDLAYDAARQQIEQAFDRSISDDSGDGDDNVDWRATIRLIEAQAAQTRDLWLPIYLMRAGARAKSLETVEDGALLLAGLCENLWAYVHPELADYGFQGRKGPCESLTRIPEFLNPLRQLPLLAHQRLGVYSGADFHRFRLNGDAEDGYGMFRALLQEVGDDALREVLARVELLTDAIRRTDAVMTAEAVGDTGTNFQPTYDVLAEITASVRVFLQEPAEDELPDAGDHDDAYRDTGDGSRQGGGDSFRGGIQSREDVVRAIDAIADYYARREPASPVPLALRRARAWVHQDFMTVLEDIVPGGIEEARRILVGNQISVESSDSGGETSSDW